MSKYIGITFGPISRITESVKSMKAMWASSYFFSSLAQKVIGNFKDRRFIFPVVDKPELWEEHSGIGCFPDRYVFSSEAGDFEQLTEQILQAFREFSTIMADTLNQEATSDKQIKAEDIQLYLQQAIKVYCLEMDLEGNDIAGWFSRQFDLLEKQESYVFKEKRNYLQEFFESPHLYRSEWVQEAFGGEAEKFKAIDRISKADLDGSKEQMAYHNYIAILSADGDSMTRTINHLQEQGESIADLSEKLYEYTRGIVGIAPEYGARIMYSGGDDLLIFAPVRYRDKNVFGLIREIDEAFREKMEELRKESNGDAIPLPTLSFGVSITYSKFPMGEALNYSRKALEQAKYAEINARKNTVVCHLQKHSGQTVRLNLPKIPANGRWSPFDLAKNMIDCYIADSDFLTSTAYWIEKNIQVFSVILQEEDPGFRKTMLEGYFERSLNEDIHRKYRNFIHQVQDYLYEVHLSAPESIQGMADKAIYAIRSTASLLRLIHFLTAKKDE